MTDGKATTPKRFFEHANEFGFTFNWAYASRTGHRVLLARAAARARPRASTAACRRSAPASTSGTGFLSERRASARRRRARRAAAELEQPVGARLHARRRRAVRLGAPRRAVRPVPAARVTLADDVERHEPRRHRGRALAGVAGRQPGAARRAGAERARPAGRRRSSTTGCGRDAPAPRRRQRRASTTTPAPAIMDALWRPIADAVMRPVFGDLLGDLDAVRGPRRLVRRVLRRQGPAHAARATGCGASSTCATAAPAR